MRYHRMTVKNDTDIPTIQRVMDLPDISQYISYDGQNYWPYVTATENVFYYKAYEGEHLIGALHLETANNILYMSILVFPEYQNKGMGTRIISDIQNNTLPVKFEKIKVSIDEQNIASIRLFEKMSFKFESKEQELLTYTYTKK